MKNLSRIFLLLFICTVSACNLTDNRSEMKEVRFLQVSTNPTMPSAQDGEHQYIADYEVLNEYPLKKKSVNALRSAFENEQNFDTLNVSRCPFMGKYAIQIDNTKAFIVSSSPCAKVMEINLESKTAKTYNLATENQIESLLKSIGENEH